MKSFSERIEHLSPAKRALLEKLLADQKTEPAAEPIPRRKSQGPAPLSFAQQRMWFLDQLEPQNPFYNVSAAVRLHGRIDAKLLERSLQEIIRRHDILRTKFVAIDDSPRQLIVPQINWKLRQVDLRDLPVEAQEQRAQQIAVEEASCGFNLATCPLFRAVLVQLTGGDSLLVLTLHHIVCDGWSIANLRKELAIIYTAFESGQASALPPLKLQYSDFSVWQRARFSGEFLARQLGYWRQTLGDDPAPLELPTDRPRPAVQTYNGSSLRRQLPADLVDQLRQFSRNERATLFMTLLAAWQVVLGRFAGQDDVAVGCPIANRRPADLEPLVGFFANTLVLRTDLSGQPTFRDLLARVRETTLGAYGHQDLPFEKLVDELQPTRDVSRPPLVQTMFVLQNIPVQYDTIGGVEIVDVNLGNGQTSAFDLTLNIDETADDLDLLLIYNTDLFDPSTSERFLSAFKAVLTAVAEDPGQTIDRLPILTDSDRRKLLQTFNQTQAEFPRDRCLHDLISHRAALDPDAPAVIEDDHVLTYGLLDRQANQLAHCLRSHGIGPNMPVGISMTRRAEMIVGLLGILKAGAPYLPLDPNYPRARLDFMAADAGLAWIVTESSLANRLPAGDAVQILLDDDQTLRGYPETPLGESCSPEDMAYLIYTSGSTGRPKGVEVPHRAVVNHALAIADRAEMGPGDRMLQYLSLSFDASAEEFFPTLVSGAALVMYADPAELTGGEILDLCVARQINLLHLPPMLWHQIVEVLETDGRHRAGPLKAFITGGEAPSPAKLRSWKQSVGDEIKFLFCYGVTEATISSTVYTPEGDIPADLARIPIGRPIANQHVYVLDANMQPAPIGVAGDLYLGGQGIARGYHNRPEQTAERFVVNPYGSGPEDRLYNTGDRARWLSDGNLEFLGRVDHQIKIRGYRIEPGEVQAAINEHPGVHESLVILREDQPGRRRLVAYVVPSGAAAPQTHELRDHARSRLPDYMTPNTFVLLDALPMTQGGKLDRRALPAPESVGGDDNYAAPRNLVEEQLVEVWQVLLGVPQVGIHDNFFELGGDSILSIQMIARARDVGVHLTPKELFLHQTVAELAAAASEASVVIAEQGPVTGPVPLTPIQHQFLAAGIGQEHHFNQSVVLSVEGGLFPEQVTQALDAVSEHHDALRLRFQQSAGQWTQTIAAPDARSPGVEHFDLREQSLADADAQRLRVIKRLQSGFDLEQGPLVHAAWFDLPGAARPQLVLVIHHLVVDAVSWRILLEDLQLACRQIISGDAIAMPPKTTSLKEWSQRIQEYASSDELLAELEHWRALAATAAASLPVDATAGENTVESCETTRCEFDETETTQLLQTANEAYHTRPVELMLAALGTAVARWTRQPQAWIDLEGHGREDLFEEVDLSRTVGWFTSMYPLVLPVTPDSQPADAIKLAKEHLRAVPRAGIGGGILRWLNQQPDVVATMQAANRAELTFNYLGQLDTASDPAALFTLQKESAGEDHSLLGRRTHLIDIVARVQSGRFSVEFTYSRNRHTPETLEQLVNGFQDALRAILGHCLTPDAGGYTPSDFPLAGIDEADLSALSELLDDDA